MIASRARALARAFLSPKSLEKKTEGAQVEWDALGGREGLATDLSVLTGPLWATGERKDRMLALELVGVRCEKWEKLDQYKRKYFVFVVVGPELPSGIRPEIARAATASGAWTLALASMV